MFVHEIWHLLSVCCGHKMINHSAANWICTYAFVVRVQQCLLNVTPQTEEHSSFALRPS